MSPRARVLCMLGALAAPLAAGAQELGRLFLEPEQRATLEARRKARIPDKPAAVIVESPTTRIDGFVMRQGGRSTFWVNGEPAREGTEPEGLRLAPRRGDPGRVSVTVRDTERRFDLKIGQKLDRESGHMSDVIGDGEIRVGRPRTSRR
jgi:hypothetical protein